MDEKVRQNLVDAGCSEGFIDDYAAAGSGSEQLCRLRQHPFQRHIRWRYRNP